MSGIVGVVKFANTSYNVEKATLKDMALKIMHRGPDGQSFYLSRDMDCGLGHVWMQLDINSFYSPLKEKDDIVVSFDGNIYDINARCKEDVIEYIVRQYQIYNFDFVERLNGEFSLALWDNKKKILILARDMFGILPLHYTIKNGIIWFCSEIKGIFGDCSITREFNLEVLFKQIMRVDSASKTIFNNVYSIPPGNMLIIDKGKIHMHSHRDIHYPIERDYSIQHMEYYSEILADKLESAVKRRLTNNTACYLSGGLDSSIIAYLMQKNSSEKIKTYSICFSDKQYDESEFSNLMAEYLGTDHHKLILNDNDLVRNFPKANYACEHLVQQIDGTGKFLLSKYASQKTKHILTGEGADEVFLGYPWMKTIKYMNSLNINNKELIKLLVKKETARLGLDLTIANHSNSLDIQKKYKYYPISFGNIETMEDFIYPIFKDSLYKKVINLDVRDEYFEDIQYCMIANRNPIHQNVYEFLKKTFSTYSVGFLGGKVEIANSLESALPFLDFEVVSFANQLPVNYHLLGLREKNLLKIAFKDAIPASIIHRNKHGYSSSILSGFLNKQSPLYFELLLSKRELDKTNLFNYDTVQKFVALCKRLDGISQKKTLYERAIIFVLSVQILHRTFIQNLPVSEII